MIGHRLDIGLLSGREQESRIEVDHRDTFVPAFSATNFKQDLIGHVSRYVVEMPRIGVGQDYGASSELTEAIVGLL